MTFAPHLGKTQAGTEPMPEHNSGSESKPPDSISKKTGEPRENQRFCQPLASLWYVPGLEPRPNYVSIRWFGYAASIWIRTAESCKTPADFHGCVTFPMEVL